MIRRSLNKAIKINFSIVNQTGNATLLYIVE